MARNDDDTTARDAAILGGGALLTYWLLRGFGGGSGLGGGSRGRAAAGTSASATPTASAPARPFCNVFIRGERYELDGAPATFATAVEACRAAGGVYVRSTGDTRQGTLDDFLRALLEAGVTWFGGGPGLDENVNRVRATLGTTKAG
ncbi:MAG: hypothetical protein K8M05_16110 [Deltaproteobacteria bacterium]|nr:hypothetical protein [Kofleriaceae bacterium]